MTTRSKTIARDERIEAARSALQNSVLNLLYAYRDACGLSRDEEWELGYLLSSEVQTAITQVESRIEERDPPALAARSHNLSHLEG